MLFCGATEARKTIRYNSSRVMIFSVQRSWRRLSKCGFDRAISLEPFRFCRSAVPRVLSMADPKRPEDWRSVTMVSDILATGNPTWRCGRRRVSRWRSLANPSSSVFCFFRRAGFVKGQQMSDESFPQSYRNGFRMVLSGLALIGDEKRYQMVKTFMDNGTLSGVSQIEMVKIASYMGKTERKLLEKSPPSLLAPFFFLLWLTLFWSRVLAASSPSALREHEAKLERVNPRSLLKLEENSRFKIHTLFTASCNIGDVDRMTKYFGLVMDTSERAVPYLNIVEMFARGLIKSEPNNYKRVDAFIQCIVSGSMGRQQLGMPVC